MTIIFSTYDVFADVPFQGNQAAVIFDRKGDGERQLLLLAQEFLLPETVMRTQKDNMTALKFATVNGIIKRCGHGTLAGIADVMLEESALIGQKATGVYRVEDSCAEWKAEIVSENCVDVSAAWIELPYEQGTLSSNDIAKTLGLSLQDINRDLPMCIYNSGNRNALVPVNSIKALTAAQPDWNRLEKLCNEQDLMDFHLYCLDKENGSKSDFELRCRNVFPFGVREESATGTASISLAAALVNTSMCQKDEDLVFSFEQGTGSRRGKIKVVWSRRGSRNPVIWLEGRVYRIMSGTLFFNPLDKH